MAFTIYQNRLRIVLFVVGFLLLLPLQSQSNEEGVTPRFTFQAHSDFNYADLLLGFSAGMVDRSYNWSVQLGLDIRPYANRKRLQLRDNYYLQVRERRYVLHLVADKHFLYKDVFGGYVEMGGGYLFGRYLGTEYTPEDRWILLPGAGLTLRLGQQTLLKLGYQYKDMDVERIPVHRAKLQMQVRF